MKNICPICQQIYFGSDENCPRCLSMLANPPHQVNLDEKRITEDLEARLIRNWRFRFVIWFEIAIIGAGLFAILYTTSIFDVKNKIEEKISTEFETPRIRQIMSQVAANQASNMMLQQINPQIEKFREGTSNTLDEYKTSLAEFEMKSTNSLEGVRSATELSELIARANSDDYSAYAALFDMMHRSDLPVPTRKTAYQIVNALIGKSSIDSLPNPLFAHNWSLYGLDESKSSLTDFMNCFNSANPNTQCDIITSIFNNSRFTKRERLECIVNVLKTSNSILVRSRAVFLVDQEVQSHKNLVDVQWFIDWWDANKDTFFSQTSG